MAKFFDVKVLSFSLGFGPELFSFRRGETTYRVALLPLGGYVKMVGELPGMEMDPEDLPRDFNCRWIRISRDFGLETRSFDQI